MNVVSNNSGDILTDNNGGFVEAQLDILANSDSDFETSLRFISENRRRIMIGLNGMNVSLKKNGLYTLMGRLWPIHIKNGSDGLIEWKGGSSLTASGDNTWNYNGISGDGSFYYDTAWNPNTRVTDINNWAFGIYSQTDDDTGVDFGCTDLTNEHSISVKDSSNVTVKNGTSQVVYNSIDNGLGHFASVSTGGTLKAFWNGVEVGTSTAVGGSLTNQNMYVGALNNNGTAANHSAKRYSTVWIYNGALSDEQVLQIDQVVRSINEIYNRRV